MAYSVHVMKMCQAFAALGHEVTLIAVDNRAQEPGAGDLFSYYGVQNNFRLVTLPFPRVKGGWLAYAFRSARAAVGLKPELLFGRYLRGLFFTWLLGQRPVFETHLPPARLDSLSLGMFRLMERWGGFRLLVVISQALKSMVEAQCSARPVLVAHDGADLAPADQEPEPLPGEFPVGYFGSLYPGRGIELILELARLAPEAHFHLVGGREQDLQRWLQNPAPPNLTLHGFVPPARALALQRGCRALLMPYQRRVNVPGLGDTSLWMSPLKMFEYMASGAAIISSDLPVLREVLADGVNALLVPPADPSAWAQALARLRNDPSLARGLAQRARRDLEERYTWGRRAELILEALGY
jgi:glycosyltransferase involved in cell wall biosynthesis